MPRKAKPQAHDVSAAIDRIRHYCDHAGISVNSLSAQAKVSQSAMSRFMNGERKTITGTARRVLGHIEKQHNWHMWHGSDKIRAPAGTADAGYDLIEDAVRSLWDGKPQTAGLVASLIKALKPALDIAVSAVTGGGSRGAEQ